LIGNFIQKADFFLVLVKVAVECVYMLFTIRFILLYGLIYGLYIFCIIFVYTNQEPDAAG